VIHIACQGEKKTLKEGLCYQCKVSTSKLFSTSRLVSHYKRKDNAKYHFVKIEMRKMADIHRLSQTYSEELLPNTAIEMTEAVLGIVGNLVVLLVYTKYIQDKTVTRYFIPVLAVVDLVGCLANAVYFYLDNTTRYVFPSVHLCKVLLFMRIMTGGLSVHLILVIALQRYLLICRPLGRQLTKKSCRICTLSLFLFSLGFAAPMLKFGGMNKQTMMQDSGNITLNISVSQCHIDNDSNTPEVMIPYLGSLLLLSFINILTTSGLYIPVTKAIYNRLPPSRQSRTSHVYDADTNLTSQDTESLSVEKVQMAEIPPQDLKRTYKERTATAKKSRRHREQNARKKISVMFLVIIIVYVVSCLTSLVVQIHNFTSDIELSGYQFNFYLFCLRLNLLNHIANPYIYWFFDIKFQTELRRICCKGTVCRRRSYSM
jgi:hypothetical protein